MAKKKKAKSQSIADVPTNVPPANRVDAVGPRATEAATEKELAAILANLCSTKMDVAFIAAEMLLHIGRGQMAAQLGHTYSHLSNSDLTLITAQTAIVENPTSPNQLSVVEKLFLGFVKSVANNNPALRKQRWKTPGASDLPDIAALSFLVGNLAWQNRTGSAPMTRQNVKDAFDAVSGAHCPAATPTAGGGRFCDWMDL